MFVYVIRTHLLHETHSSHNAVETYTYPKVVEAAQNSSINNNQGEGEEAKKDCFLNALEDDCHFQMDKTFPQNYEIRAKSFYEKSEIGKRQNLCHFISTFSFYSVTFYNTHEHGVPIFFFRTNQNNIEDLNKYYQKVYQQNQADIKKKEWEMHFFKHLSVPPRCRLYLFELAHFQGKTMTFENNSNAHNVYEIFVPKQTTIQSMKWYSLLPMTNKYRIDPISKTYRPLQVDDAYDLNEQNSSYKTDLNLPVYIMQSHLDYQTRINNYFN